MWTFGRASNNASKWEMGFNSVAYVFLTVCHELTIH